ncbi:hypothetical protein MASR2M70_03230 [Bacillota bacterium]
MIKACHIVGGIPTEKGLEKGKGMETKLDRIAKIAIIVKGEVKSRMP